MTYYLINTMSAVEPAHLGRIVSRHRTEENACAANAKLQRQVKRANGRSSYLPTIIRSSDEAYQDGADAWER